MSEEISMKASWTKSTWYKDGINVSVIVKSNDVLTDINE